MKTLLSISTALFLMACTNKQIYTTVQNNHRLECGKLPQDQYEQCMQEVGTSYEDYEQERQEILEARR